MPTINAYYTNPDHELKLAHLQSEIKKLAAALLTCGSIALKPQEVSPRLIKVAGDGMIGSIELEIHAYAFPERIAKQDEICLVIRTFMMKKIPAHARVWLVLSELGHSWEA